MPTNETVETIYNWNVIKDILTITVPFVTAILLSWINSRANKNSQKKETLHKRFNNFYFPFYKKYIELFLYSHEYELSHMDFEIIESFTTLCIDNLYLMDTNSQKYVPKLYEAYLNLFEFRSEKENILEFESEYSKAFDDVFHPLVKSILVEYKDICNKLKLPKPAL